MQTVLLLIASTLVLFLIKRFLEFLKATRAIQYAVTVPLFGGAASLPFSLPRSNHPGFRTLFSHLGPLRFVFKKPIKYITKGVFAPWRKKYADFADCGVDIVSSVSSPRTTIWPLLTKCLCIQVTVLPRVRILFAVADPAAIKASTPPHRRALQMPGNSY